MPIVEIEEKEQRVARSRERKKKGVVGDESMNAREFSLFFLSLSLYFLLLSRLLFDHYPSGAFPPKINVLNIVS